MPFSVFAEDVYDVILFWGQSNMVGTAGTRTCNDNKTELNHVDSNLTSLGASKFSEKTGIPISIVNKYTTMGHVDVPLISNTVYSYLYTSNKIVSLEKNTQIIGENLYAHLNSNKVTFKSTTNASGLLSARKSHGTNIIPWFGKTYYEKTGHKVIAVFVAVGSQQIGFFLPHNDNASSTSVVDTNNERYMYEAMIASYKGAIQYLQAHNMKIGNKFHVVFQGEANVTKAVSDKSTQWRAQYENIHKNLKRELGLEFGVIIKTSTTVGRSGEAVEIVHQAQNSTISANSDVILGSDYSYK